MRSLPGVRALVARLALTAAIAGCGTGAPADTRAPVSSPAPTGTAVPDVALDHTFTSALYAYSVNYPAAFRPRSATLPLQGASAPLIDGETVDQLTGPNGAVIVLAATAPVADTTLDEWTALTALAFCGDATTSELISLDGGPATLSTFARCGGMFHQWVTAIHEGLAFHVIWAGAPGTEAADRSLFLAILETFAFGSD